SRRQGGDCWLEGTWTRARHDSRDDVDGRVHGRSCQPWVNLQQHACRAIFLPQVQSVGTRL
ncbi:hypothetical protein BGZ89_007411, partial [Linnemannia elongata]